jgi:predicted 3-demethylubiquinone-9 3-methyltransferase (glyoxalase superfamily)
MKPKNTICLWFDKEAHEAARFYAATFPDSAVTAVQKAPSDYPSGKQGDVLTVEFTVVGIPCLGPAGRRSSTARPSPSRSRQTIKRKRTATGRPSSATAARKVRADGARTAGASPGRSPRAR